MRARLGLGLVLLSILSAVVLTAGAASSPSAAPICVWRSLHAVRPSARHSYSATVVAAGPYDYWAGGGYANGLDLQHESPLLERWNGRVWRQVALPKIRGGVKSLAVIADDESW